MTDQQGYELILRMMRVFNSFTGPDSGDVWWRTDGKYAPFTLLVKCNDLFYWGCADCVKLDIENISVLEQCLADLREVDPKMQMWADLLFCCRANAMRPQGACYPDFDRTIWHLFDDCGPEREINLGNPYTPEEAMKREKK